MTLLIGTDEAGYGPNLGPLMISATAWHVPTNRSDVDLYELLLGCVSRAPTDQRTTIADSKSVYSSSLGLGGLERTVFATLSALQRDVRSWRDIWIALAPNLDATILDLPWHRTYDEPLPIEVDGEELSEAADRLCAGLAAACVRLHSVEVDAIFPCEFNRLVNEHGSKGSVLSQRTLQLVDRVLRSNSVPLTEDSWTVVQCDKHGGRNRYQAVLQSVFPDYLVEVVREGRECSVYRWGPPSRRVEFRFTAKGEKFLPTALASMYAKYLRELAMRAFNAFWQTHQPGLKPTAGYPVDAIRFQADIAAKQLELAIDSRLLWRSR